PGPQQRRTSRKTMLVGFKGDEIPPDADGDDWELPLSDDEEPVKALPVHSRAASPAPFKADLPAPVAAGARESQGQASDIDEPLRQLIGGAGKGLLAATFLLGSFFAGLQVFGANSTDLSVARQESKAAKTVAPATPVDSQPALELADF